MLADSLMTLPVDDHRIAVGLPTAQVQVPETLQGIEVLDLLEDRDIGLGGEDRLGPQVLAGIVGRVDVAWIGQPAIDDGLLGIDGLVELVTGEEVLDVDGVDSDGGHKNPP